MKRAEIAALMKLRVDRLAEFGEAVQAALGAVEKTADDLAAIMTAADLAKVMADEFKGAAAGAVGKEARAAVEFEHGLRQFSMGAGSWWPA